MTINEFLELLPVEIRNLPPIQAMTHLIISQASLIQKQSQDIQFLQKTVAEFKGTSPEKKK